MLWVAAANVVGLPWATGTGLRWPRGCRAVAADGPSLRGRNVAVGGWYLPVCLSLERDTTSVGLHQDPPMVKAAGWVFDGQNKS